MKIWYYATCDKHKEYCAILVSNPSCGAALLSSQNEVIQAWLELHHGCDLRLIHRDDELDKMQDYLKLR